MNRHNALSPELLALLEDGTPEAFMQALHRCQWQPNEVDEKGFPLLFRAVFLQRLDIAERLIRAGFPVDSELPNGWTPLLWATLNGDETGANFLLRHGANANATSPSGETLLTIAAWKGFYDIAQSLLAFGASPDAINSDGLTASAVATQYGHTAILRLIEATTSSLLTHRTLN